MCILKEGVVCSHIFIPIFSLFFFFFFFFFVYGYSFVFWIIVVIMGWVRYIVVVVNVCFKLITHGWF